MKLVPFIVNTLIAPHGITDIGHCLITNNSKNLLKIYGINLTFTNIIANNYNFLLFILDMIFLK